MCSGIINLSSWSFWNQKSKKHYCRYCNHSSYGLTASSFEANTFVSATDISASLRVTFHSLPVCVSYSLIDTSHFLYGCLFSIIKTQQEVLFKAAFQRVRNGRSYRMVAERTGRTRLMPIAPYMISESSNIWPIPVQASIERFEISNGLAIGDTISHSGLKRWPKTFQP